MVSIVSVTFGTQAAKGTHARAPAHAHVHTHTSEVKTKENKASSLLFLCTGHLLPNTRDSWAGVGS